MPVKTSSRKTVSAEARNISKEVRSKASGPRKSASIEVAKHIMPAPKGKRTLTHRQIEAAVKRVFERRSSTNG
jgi:hypothetical protein